MTEFLDPSDPGPVDPSRVERSADGRPRIRVECPNVVEHVIEDDGTDHGRVWGKREGTTKQCPKCKGRGYRAELYTQRAGVF